MVLKNIISGFFVKAITGFDDTMTHIPIVGNLTRTKRGRIAFSLGIILAISLAIIISLLFASLIKKIQYYKYISAGLIFILALFIYFDILTPKRKEKAKQKIKKLKGISPKRFFKLIGIGFIAAFATVIDDSIAYSSLFLGSTANAPFAILGIYIAVLFEVYIIIHFAKKVQKFKYKKEVTVFGLIILSILILLGVL